MMDREELQRIIDSLADDGRTDEVYPYLLEMAHTYHDPDAFETLAVLNFNDCLKKGIDYKKAFQFFVLACKAGANPVTILTYVTEKDNDNIKKDINAKEGYHNLLVFLMEQDCALAYIYAGDEYLGTEFVFDPDTEKGLACYKKAAELGMYYGYECLGRAYFTGTAGEVDYQKAFEYFTMKDEFYSDEKYYDLGEMYFHGYYVEKDLKKAEEYYKGLLNDEVFKDTDSMFFPLAKKRLLEMEE